jgi:hypothetical protein
MSVDPPEKPIRSSRANEPDVEERIDAFVFGLGEAIDGVQDAELAGDRVALARRARELARTSQELGYEPLALTADKVAVASMEAGPEATRKAVAELTRLTERVRRGHRSAA